MTSEDIILHISDTRTVKDILQTRDANRKTLDANWIQTKTFINGAGTDYTADITYYDGLGYPTQTIAAAASPSGKSIVSPVHYDSLRRDNARIYLPYVSASSTGERQTDMFSPSRYTSMYGSTDDAYAYVENTFDAYGLDRILTTRNCGKVMSDHNRKTLFEFSTVSAVDSIRKISVSDDNSNITISGYHTAGSLFKYSSTDEDWKTTTTFIDRLGRTVMTRKTPRVIMAPTSNMETFAATYYVYDSFGRIAWIVTPEGSAELVNGSVVSIGDTTATNWCYVYRYDGLGRIYEKHRPGRGVEYTVYDKGGRAVLVQDAVQRTQGRWIYTVYDNMDRPIEESLVHSTLSRAQIQAYYDASSFSNAYPMLGGASDARKPLSGTLFTLVDHLSSTRYGGGLYRNTPTSTATAEFTVPAVLGFSAVAGVVTAADKDARTTSLKTYEKLAVLSDSTTTTYIERAFFYDAKEQLIQIVEKNHLGGIDRTSYSYDFSGNILKVHESHKSSPTATAVTKLTAYSYDSRNRLLSESTRVGDGTAGTVAYTYDELGRQKTKTFGNGVAETLTYNTQGWVTHVENALDGNNVFDSQLKYYDATYASKRYAGDISELFWLHGNATAHNGYIFDYDYLGRLETSAFHNNASQSNSFAETGISYDLNGNILTLTRYGSGFIPLNILKYSYSGNRLLSITDRGSEAPIPLGVPYSRSYSYDLNGNMTRSDDISYNLLNLPLRVERTDGAMDYKYAMDGTKVELSGSRGSYYYLGSLTYTSSSGGKAFEGTPFGGGRIVASGSTTVPIYFTTDHLGSVRVVTDTVGKRNRTERNDY